MTPSAISRMCSVKLRLWPTKPYVIYRMSSVKLRALSYIYRVS